jgi:hypothetical protein
MSQVDDSGADCISEKNFWERRNQLGGPRKSTLGTGKDQKNKAWGDFVKNTLANTKIVDPVRGGKAIMANTVIRGIFSNSIPKNKVA